MRHEIAAKHAASRGSLSAGPCGCRRRRGSQSTLAARARGRPAAQGEPSGSTGRSSTFAAGSRRRRRLSSTSVTALPHGILTARLQKPVSAHPHQPLQCTRPARDRSRGLMQAAEWGWRVTATPFSSRLPAPFARGVRGLLARCRGLACIRPLRPSSCCGPVGCARIGPQISAARSKALCCRPSDPVSRRLRRPLALRPPRDLDG
jgi:hypothetical protein